MGRKALSRTDRYRDERVGDVAANIVAPAGQRLRTSVPLATVVIIGAVVAFWALTVVGDLVGG